MRKLVYNAIQCLNCRDIIESKHRYDFVTCTCGSCTVDGGLDYSKRSGDPDKIVDRCFYLDDPFEVIRNYVKVYGKYNIPRENRFKFGIKLSNLSDEMLSFCIEAEEVVFKLGLSSRNDINLLVKERVYRNSKTLEDE